MRKQYFGIFMLILSVFCLSLISYLLLINLEVVELNESNIKVLNNNLKKIEGIEVEYVKLKKPVYVISYVGDIDGDISEDWFWFFELLNKFYEDNEIDGTFSFYPKTINSDKKFLNIFLDMYENEYVELMQKGSVDKDSENEKKSEDIINKMRDLLLEEQKIYVDTIKRETGEKEVEVPISYTLLNGRATVELEEALYEDGFRMYFDVYYDDEIGTIDAISNVEVIQYGVGFTSDGQAGAETTFRSSNEIINEFNDYKREDVKILKIDGIPVIPLWVHQQDFEEKSLVGELNSEKWSIYRETLMKLKDDPNAILVTPSEVIELLKNSNKMESLN